jgi:predicted nucleic acid-binding protein
MVFIDTNILVYTVDPTDLNKQRQAIEELDQLIQAGTGVLSAQILSEYFAVVTRKLSPPVSVETARQHLDAFRQLWPVVPVTAEIVIEAARATEIYHLNLWDAQIWAAAKLAGARELLTEDLNDGETIEGVRIRNPFTHLERNP